MTKVTVTLTEWQLRLLRDVVRDRWDVLAAAGVDVVSLLTALGVQES